ncbi:glycosyltransferase family 2 protein [Derxia gummosa]|uniref:Glycosyltransferase family 2 protein n=1 Tax=Derxia gummosa DSM 723 TaxID=1121388 RepID=A0A9U5G0A2_9BURK|nr:glycosyltransferase [Derxia gummosa]
MAGDARDVKIGRIEVPARPHSLTPGHETAGAVAGAGPTPAAAMPDNATGAAADPRAGVLASVVVPSYRRPALLERCLRALLAQDIDPRRYEIIVCDDGPDDATLDVVRRLGRESGGRPLLRYLAVTGTQGPAGARNRGWEDSHAPVIAFTDDDTIPEPGWLGAGLMALRPGVDAVAGAVVVPLPPRPTDYERNESGLAGARFVTANCFVRRSALVAVGGFDERFTAAWREDSDLEFALDAAGRRIGQAPDARVAHPVRPAGWGVSLKQQRKAQFDALLYRKWPRRYRAGIGAVPRADYWLVVAALLLAIGAALAGARGTALFAFAAWLGWTLAFALRRLRGNSLAPAHVAEMLVTSALIPPLSVGWRLVGALRFRVLFA